MTAPQSTAIVRIKKSESITVYDAANKPVATLVCRHDFGGCYHLIAGKGWRLEHRDATLSFVMPGAAKQPEITPNGAYVGKLPTADHAMCAVCVCLGVAVEDVTTDKLRVARVFPLPFARGLFSWVCHERIGLSYPETMVYLSPTVAKTHTSALEACKRLMDGGEDGACMARYGIKGMEMAEKVWQTAVGMVSV